MKRTVTKLFCLLVTLCACMTSEAQKVADSLPVISNQVKSIREKVRRLNPVTPVSSELNKLSPDKIISSINPSAVTNPITTKVDFFLKGKPVQFDSFFINADYSYIRDTSGIMTGTYHNIEGFYSYQAGTTVSLIQMPFNFSMQANNGIYTMDHTPLSNFGQFNFDHDKYMEKLQSQVLDKIKPEMVLASVMKRIVIIRSGYEQQLRKEIESIKSEYYEKYKTNFSLPEGISDLSMNDMSSLKNQVLGSVNMGKLSENADRYEQLLKGNRNDITDSMANEVAKEAGKKQALEKIYSRVQSWKTRFEDNKLVKELRTHLPFTPSNYKSFLSKPGNLQQTVKQYANLSSLQSLFMNITKLDLGNNAVQQGEFSLDRIVNNGINTQFQNSKMAAGVIYGKNNNINNWMQAGLNGFVSNEYNSLSGFRLGTGSGSPIEQSVAINFFEFAGTPDSRDNFGGLLSSSYLPSGPRKDAVISLHTGIPVVADQIISLDLSGSFGGYTNSMAKDSSAIKNGSFSGQKQKDNYAIGLDYCGEIFKTTVQTAFKRAGMGYNNPGNIFLRRGETRTTVSLGRKFFRNKLNVKYGFDYRNQVLDPAKIYRSISVADKIQIGWRFNRNVRVNLTWQQSNYKSSLSTDTTARGINRRIQADGSYRIKVFDIWVNNNAILSYLQMNLPAFAGYSYKSNSWLTTHTSSLLLGKNILSLTEMMNISSNSDYYFNTSFYNTEMNYSYAAGEKIRLGSGTGYYSNVGWNRQIGIKQQVGLSVIKNLSFDLDVSYKKAVRIIRPELADQFFGTISMHYQF